MNSRLAPTEAFPQDLSALDDTGIQILHSRVQRQLDHEYANEFEAHPETECRLAELLEEFNRRTTEDSTWRTLLHHIVHQDTVDEGIVDEDTVTGSPAGADMTNIAFHAAAFEELIDDLTHAAAWNFMTSFESLLDGRIQRIGQALKDRNKEEAVAAMRSLQASAAIAGATQLHASITRALANHPIEMTPAGPLVRHLETEATLFSNALMNFSHHRTPDTAQRTR